MTLDASSYFDHIKAYISDEYIVDRGDGAEIVLVEKYFREGATRKSARKVKLGFKGKAFAVKLDGRQNPLFHFLDDNGKQWSKRCDFVIFHFHARRLTAFLIEFKTKSLEAQSIIDQLKSGVNWCASLRKIIQQYTGDSKPIWLKKFVFTDNTNPDVYLDAENRFLARDPSIRHYHYDDLVELGLGDLDNESIKRV